MKAAPAAPVREAPGPASAGASRVWIGLGANLGERADTLRAAIAALAAVQGTHVQRVSSLYRSAPVNAGGPDYLNAVAELRTTLAPQALLQALQAIEHAAGRERPYRNAPRTLDLDILLFGERVIDTPTLTVPHPRLHERAFVLLPLAELAPERVAPGALRAVQGQAIARSAGPEWARGPVAQGACLSASEVKASAKNSCAGRPRWPM